jgi:hypothetical protein
MTLEVTKMSEVHESALPNKTNISELNPVEVIKICKRMTKLREKNILILPPIYMNPQIGIYLPAKKKALPPINPHNLWSKLPEDVLKYIYDSHFNTKNRFDTMMTVVKSVSCRQLFTEELLPFVKEMFVTNRELLLYTLRHFRNQAKGSDDVSDAFIMTYSIFTKGNLDMQFPRLKCKFERFALTWLMYAYH